MTAFTVWGDPVPKGNLRRNRQGFTYDADAGLKTWMQAVGWAARAQGEVGAALWEKPWPVKMEVVFYLRRPQHHFVANDRTREVKDSAPAWPAGPPDTDKLLRAVLDALTKVLYDDDSQVVHVHAQKRYCARGEASRAIIDVTPIATTDGVYA